MDLLKRQEIVIEKSTELKQLVGLALSLDECEEFVSDVLKASEERNCNLADVSESNLFRELSNFLYWHDYKKDKNPLKYRDIGSCVKDYIEKHRRDSEINF